MPLRLRQRAIFGGIGRQLVQAHANHLGRAWLQQDGGAVNAGPTLVALAIGREFLHHQGPKVRAGPARLREQRMGVGQRLNASIEGLFEVLYQIICSFDPHREAD